MRHQEQRGDPDCDGGRRDQSQPADLAVAGLTLQLQPQHALGPLALRRRLLAVELDAARIAIERLLQRRDHDAGQARLETNRRATAAGLEQLLLLLLLVRHRTDLPAADDIGDADHRVENL